MKLNLTELEELMLKTEPLPWHQDPNGQIYADKSRYYVLSVNLKEDSRFVLALVNAFPSILKTLRVYEEAIEKVRDMEVDDEGSPAFFRETMWRSKRDAILDDLDKKLSEIE